MENKQTAVQWFASQLGITSGTMLEQAKEMERLQLTDAQSYAVSNADMTNNRGYFDCNKWYAETYGSDETLKDNHIVDTNEMVSSQTEISDEEIKKAAHEHGYEHHSFFTAATSNQKKLSWIAACKWYREQLKSRQ